MDILLQKRECERVEPVAVRRIGGYRILGRLGHGGMAEVFLGHDPRHRRPVAIKRLRPERAADPAYRVCFLAEARALARIDHPAVVRYHELLWDDGPSMVLEYVAGTTLGRWLDGGPADAAVIDAPRLIALGRQLAAGLAAIHRGALVHNDLKAENVMLTPAGGVKIVDFGLAAPPDDRAGGEPAGHPPKVTGTAGVMSPEQAAGEPVDTRSDLFSLGVLLYQLATGRLPFLRRSFIQSLRSVLEDHPAPVAASRPDLPPGLAALIDVLLAKNPERRPRSAAQIGVMLMAIAAR